MSRNIWLSMFAVVLLLASACPQFVAAKETDSGKATTRTGTADEMQVADEHPGAVVDLFQAMDNGQADVSFIARNDHAGRVIITNKTKQPLNLRLPEAFAGVPVLAQFGGGGGGGNFGGGGGGGLGGGGGGGQQSTGGGLGGGGGGQGGGGGGGFFSVPPEQTRKINVPLLCLDHGLRDPSSSKPYKMVPAANHIDKPEVIELIKAFGRGEIQHAAAQAAAWNLHSDVSWNQLAAKLTGTRRNFNRGPYFSAAEIRAGMAYASEARRLAIVNADQYRQLKQDKLAAPADKESSETRSTAEMKGVTSPSDDAAESSPSAESAQPPAATE